MRGMKMMTGMGIRSCLAFAEALQTAYKNPFYGRTVSWLRRLPPTSLGPTYQFMIFWPEDVVSSSGNGPLSQPSSTLRPRSLLGGASVSGVC